MTSLKSYRLLAASLCLFLLLGAAGASLLRCRLAAPGEKAAGTELMWESLSRPGFKSSGLIGF
ncbi:MAG: hypothetical protein EOO15_05665 [Chitinophagaceae bacterium]|nr:MAG: hypothetical protein EOO15_05665 [Chitinophagaceae bacterium]